METAKMRYGVFVLKRDQEHLQALETESFDEAKKLWVSLKEQWTGCLHEQKPFELHKPLVTAFDPGLIYEITVRPVSSDVTRNPDNPYQQKMAKEGFSNTFRGGEVLDGGYK